MAVGANRGIGLNILKAFVSRSWNVTGTVRPQSKGDTSVDEVRQSHPSFHMTCMLLRNDERYGLFYQLTPHFACEQLRQTGANILEVDYLEEDTIQRAALAYGDKRLDVLINVGGEMNETRERTHDRRRSNSLTSRPFPSPEAVARADRGRHQ